MGQTGIDDGVEEGVKGVDESVDEGVVEGVVEGEKEDGEEEGGEEEGGEEEGGEGLADKWLEIRNSRSRTFTTSIARSRSRESTTRRGITVVVDVLLASLSADLDSFASLASFLRLAVSRAFAIAASLAAFFLAACCCFAASRCCWAVCISSSCCCGGGGAAAMDDFNWANLSFIFCISAWQSSLHWFTICSMIV